MCKRHELYFRLTPTEFAREFSDLWDRPATLQLDGKTHTLQFNFCTNPLCEHFGLPQAEFSDVVGKPSRYNLKGTGGAEQHNSRLKCKKIAGHSTGICLENTSDTLSNWSAALEIARPATIDRVVHPEPEYEFHREDCEARDKSPLTLSPKERHRFFHKRGRSTANCAKYQCKSCGKITNVLPSARRNLTYLQKKSDLNVRFAEALVNKTAIIRLCEMLHLSPGSYYSKLKWLYLRCLEFLDRYERQGFERITLDEAWLNVDSLVYRLNQSRRRGEAKGRSKYPVNAPWLQTHLVTVAEGRTYYCLRADLAYDSEADLKEIDRDTVAYRDDHLHNFCRKNDRFERWSVTPQPPADYDPESTDAYRAQLREMELRQRYVEGLHTNPTYTCLASLWLVKHLLKARKWRIVTDDDSALLSAIPRAFALELKERAAHLFVCKIQQRTKKTSRQKGAAKETGEQKEPPGAEPAEVLKADRKTKFLQYIESRRRLAQWAAGHGYTTQTKDREQPNFLTYYEAARLQLLEQFSGNPCWPEWLYELADGRGKRYPKSGKELEHPLPDKSEGKRTVICKTDLTECNPEEAADLVMGVSFHAINTIFNSVRRRVFLIERPIVGTSASSGTGRTYLYSNRKPEVMAMVLTVFRLWWNFIHLGDKDKKTPAMRMGLVDRPFTWRDVVYFSGSSESVASAAGQPAPQPTLTPARRIDVPLRVDRHPVDRKETPAWRQHQEEPDTAVAQSSSLGIAASVDVETTGFSPRKSEVVELGIVLFTFDRKSHQVVEVIDSYTGMREPSRPIPKKAVEVHGITDEMVKGKRLDDEKVEQLIARAEFIIAHNAPFDRGFVEKLYPAAGRKPWYCSMSGIDWLAHGHSSKGLENLIRDHRIEVPGSHRAEYDALAVVKLLACCARDGKTFLCKLVS